MRYNRGGGGITGLSAIASHHQAMSPSFPEILLAKVSSDQLFVTRARTGSSCEFSRVSLRFSRNL